MQAAEDFLAAIGHTPLLRLRGPSAASTSVSSSSGARTPAVA